VRFCGGACRGPRVPSEDYSAWAEASGPDRSKRWLGRSGGSGTHQIEHGTRKLIEEADEE
jgi:hypothetical protein